MKILELIKVFTDVSGLNINQIKTVIYYAMATHKLKKFNWFPALGIIGPPGTGKSKTIDTAEPLCYKPLRITCHATMTPVALRDELARARNRTAIIEEVDLYPSRKQLQGYLINRVDRVRTSGLAVKEQVESDTGLKTWKTSNKEMYGATIFHDRFSLDDMAADSRVIAINTIFKEGSFLEPPKGLSLPAFKLGSVPDYFAIKGRAFDTWLPLIKVASGLGDDDWLYYAFLQIEKAQDQLKDGHIYEEIQSIFAQVIKAYCGKGGNGLTVNCDKGLILQNSVVDPLRQQGMNNINPRTVKNILTKMGLSVVRSGGTNKLFTTKEELIKIAKEIGYEDEALK